MRTRVNNRLEKEVLVEELSSMISHLEQELLNTKILVKKNKDEFFKVKRKITQMRK